MYQDQDNKGIEEEEKGEWVSPCSRQRSFSEQPQSGMGQIPGHKQAWVHFELERHIWCIEYFCDISYHT